METFEKLFESVADYQSGLPRAKSLIETAMEYIGSAAKEIKDSSEENLGAWNRLGEIYGDLKEFYSDL